MILSSTWRHEGVEEVHDVAVRQREVLQDLLQGHFLRLVSPIQNDITFSLEFLRVTTANAVAVNQRPWLEEKGQWLENVD